MKSRRRRSLPHVASCSGTAPAAATTPPQYRAWPRIPGPHKQRRPPRKPKWHGNGSGWDGMGWPNRMAPRTRPLPSRSTRAPHTRTNTRGGTEQKTHHSHTTPHHTTPRRPVHSHQSLSLSLSSAPAGCSSLQCSSGTAAALPLRPSPAALPLESGSQSSGGGGKSVASSTARNNPPANAGDRLVPSLV